MRFKKEENVLNEIKRQKKSPLSRALFSEDYFLAAFFVAFLVAFFFGAAFLVTFLVAFFVAFLAIISSQEIVGKHYLTFLIFSLISFSN